MRRKPKRELFEQPTININKGSKIIPSETLWCVCVCARERSFLYLNIWVAAYSHAVIERPKHTADYMGCVCVCTLYGCEPFTPTAIKGPHRITMHHNAIYHKHQSQWKNAVSYSKQKAYESDGLPTFCSFNEKLSRSTFPLTLVRSLVLLTKDAN